MVATLEPPGARDAREVAERFRFDAGGMRTLASGSAVRDEERRLHVGRDGAVSAVLAAPDLETREPIATEEARSRGEDAIARYRLDDDGPLVFDRLVDMCQASAPSADPERQDGPRVTGRVVQYRQVINDLPVPTPEWGRCASPSTTRAP